MNMLKKYINLLVVASFFFLIPVSLHFNTGNIKKGENFSHTTHFSQQKGEIISHTSQQNDAFVSLSPSVAYAAGYFTSECAKEGWWGSKAGCYAAYAPLDFLHWILITAGNVLAGMTAIIMDFFLQHSIQSSSYNNSDFITQGWQILRDVTNIIFIFALIYVAFELVLQVKGNAKKRLMKIILVALTVNFSLFMSFAIIDASNIFAHVFYNKIVQKNQNFTTDGSTNGITISGSSASIAIAQNINPQNTLMKVYTAGVGQKLILVLIGGAINIAMIYVFLTVSLLFLGRTVGLWIAAILSPLAMASITIPGLEKIPYIGFKKWFESLLQMSFMAPVFLFMLYLTVRFTHIGMGSNFTGTGFLDQLLGTIIPMAAILTLILLSKKVATSMSGDFAGVISGFVTKGLQGALAVGAVAVGAGAMFAGGIGSAGARGIGRFQKWRGKEESAEKWKNHGRRFASMAKLDLTKIPGFGKVTGQYGTLAKKATGYSARDVGRGAKLKYKKMREGFDDWKKGKTFHEEEHKYRTKSEAYDDEWKKRKETGAASWQKKIKDEQERTVGETILTRKIDQSPDVKSAKDQHIRNTKLLNQAKFDPTKKIKTTMGEMNYEEQKRQTKILEEMIEQKKEEMREKAKKGDIDPKKAAEEVQKVKDDYDRFVSTTFEGKVEKSKKEIEKAILKEKHNVANAFDGEYMGPDKELKEIRDKKKNKSIAKKIRSGKIDYNENKSKSDDNKK